MYVYARAYTSNTNIDGVLSSDYVHDVMDGLFFYPTFDFFTLLRRRLALVFGQAERTTTGGGGEEINVKKFKIFDLRRTFRRNRLNCYHCTGDTNGRYGTAESFAP